MTDSSPTNMESFLTRFRANQMVVGESIGNIFTHAPCCFCAAPDFMVFEISEVRSATSKGATCSECGRSAKAVFTDVTGINNRVNGVSFEIVQTGGSDPPGWLVPKVRRIM